MKHFSGDEEEE